MLRRTVLAAAFALFVAAGGETPAPRAAPPPGTAASTTAMGERLRAIFAANDWKSDPNKPEERARYYAGLLAGAPLAPQQELAVRQQLAAELMHAGDSLAAAHTLEQTLNRAALLHAELSPATLHDLHFQLAMAWLRVGEQQNCLSMHGQHSCVFPIRGSGVHKLQLGAASAVHEFTWVLEHPFVQGAAPEALSQWLLNVAYMQLGQYPRSVPAQWLVPESRFASESDPGEFLDYATLAGTDVTHRSGGVLLEDFDGDGLLDIMLSSSGPLDQMQLLHNNGDGTFADRTAEAGLTGEIGGLNLVLTDFDNDGHPDVLVLRGAWWGRFGQYPLSLLHNRGDGTFEDVTIKAGLLSPHPTQAAAWADFDNDGWLDLIVPHESSPDDPHPTQLFHNNHDGTFTDVAPALHLDRQGFVKGVAWGDYNNDGRPDLYLSVKDGPGRLLRNDGPLDPAHPSAARWRLTDVTMRAGVNKSRQTFATWFFDYDNDGWPDLFVAGYSTQSMEDVGLFQLGRPAQADLPHLYHNNHDGTFTDVAHATHLDRAILTMGANFGDFDNDGWLDVYLGTGEPAYEALLPNRAFRNNGGHTFEDVTTATGLGHLQKGHSIAFGDIENSGNEDIVEEMGGGFPGDTYQSALYRNPGHPGTHSLTLMLEGVETNRAAYGAHIDLAVSDGSMRRHIFRTVGSVSSFGGSSMRQHIGIGHAKAVEELTITWPVSHRVQRFRNLAADQVLRIRESSDAPTPVHLHAFTLGQTAVVHGEHHH